MNIEPRPYIPQDVALLAMKEIRPYVVAGDLGLVRPLRIPRTLLMLRTGAGSYLHTDPVDILAKYRSLLAEGIAQAKSSDVRILRIGTEDKMDFRTLWPGTEERFYFASDPGAIEDKSAQIADPEFIGARFFCPVGRQSQAGYFVGEKVEPGMDVVAMMRGEG